ncbi:MAG: transglutaminase-like domain-containing protein [Candidatus Shapirobacteria bacterium]
MFIFIFLFFSLLLPKSALAVGEFNSVQNITYNLNQNGDATISQDIELTNNYSEIYPKEYQISISGPSMQNIKASDELGNILQKSTKLDDTTSLFLKFNQNNLGKNKKTDFKLNYEIPRLAVHKGSVWEISLPEYKNINDTDNVLINLNVPDTFGTLSFSSITPQNSYSLDKQTHLQFNSANIKNKKILIAFGNYQIFDFSFKYFLDNPSSKILNTEIALPPETDNQKIILKSIEPKPSEIKVDKDGNWLAQYQLQAKQSLEISVAGQAKIISSISKAQKIDTSSLTQAQKYWPVSDQTIDEITKTLKTPKDIYDYVVNTLSYDYSGLNSAQRKGAFEALLNPQASLCTEFTDLFVTLARSKGIPAREVEGFAYTNNPKIKPTNVNADILHAWPQYYDSTSQKWISIDPTWGKTTNGIDFFNDLDLNHFAFVIHGQNSEYPPPPGAYKNNRNIKTVFVDFATQEIKETNFPVQISSNKTNFNENPQIIITNPNSNSLNNITISMSKNNWQEKIEIIPPFTSVKIKVPNLNFFQSLSPKNQKLTFEIKANNNQTPSTYSIAYPNHYLNLLISIGSGITILIIGAIILLVNRKSKK